MRKRIYEIIEPSSGEDRASSVYDIFNIVVILISIFPLAFKEQSRLFIEIDFVAAIIFSVDYVLREMTADYKLKKGAASFLFYPVTPFAIIDLVSILPSFTFLSGGFRLLRLFRLLRCLRVFRAFKLLRYSKNFEIIVNVFKKQKRPLLAVCWMAVGYVLISALVIFNVEPESYDNFFDAVYWATVSLTTMGYGDIYPVTTAGRVVTMISAFFGIAIVALPAGIITAGYMDEINRDHAHDDENDE